MIKISNMIFKIIKIKIVPNKLSEKNKLTEIEIKIKNNI